MAAFAITLTLTAVASADNGGWYGKHSKHSAKRAEVSGRVEAAGQPASGWRVELRAGSPNGSRLLDSTVSRGGGEFELRYRSRRRDTILYLVARRDDSRRMLAMLGPSDEIPRKIVVNELATVASVYTSAQLLDGESIEGNEVGLVAAARNVPNLVDPATGGPGAVVQNVVNGTRTNTLATLNTLASILAECLIGRCRDFFSAATPPGERRASDTLQALHYIALNPWHNVLGIFDLRPPVSDGGAGNPVFVPTLLFAPTAWTLSLVYAEGGFNAPGGLSVDAHGNLWTNNNFVPGSQSVLFTIGDPSPPDPHTFSGTGVTKLASNGAALSPPTGFLGGGTFGAAFGIAINRRGRVLIGNFAGDSVTELRPDGTPVSPDSSSAYASDGGYHHPSFDDIQSIIVDQAGDVWVTNLGGNSVSQMVGGDPGNIRVWGADAGCAVKFATPWGLASDQHGRIWVTNSASNSVSVIDPRSPRRPLCPRAEFPLGRPSEPQGIAVDFDGNIWVAETAGASVVMLDASNGFAPTRFTADRTAVGPWGVAVDGANNIWVADFFGKRVLNLCGSSANCPLGRREVGDRISPPGRRDSDEARRGGGYGANGALQSITSVVIDQAGNLWLANNFDDVEVCLRAAAIPPEGEVTTSVEERLQVQCGGNGAVVVLGIAAPVAAPLIGPPVQP